MALLTTSAIAFNKPLNAAAPAAAAWSDAPPTSMPRCASAALSSAMRACNWSLYSASPSCK